MLPGISKTLAEGALFRIRRENIGQQRKSGSELKQCNSRLETRWGNIKGRVKGS
jgi:hypothetical protein